MGYNTTVVVLNDALDAIAEDATFGKKLADAVAMVQRGRPVYVPAVGRCRTHCNAAIVIETHHASHEVMVSVGGNTGRLVPEADSGGDRG